MRANIVILLVLLKCSLTVLTGCPAATTTGTGSSNSDNDSSTTTTSNGDSGTSAGGGSSAIASVTITTAPASLLPGATLQLGAVAKDAAGNVISAATITFSGTNVHIAETSTDGRIEAFYPGEVAITAKAGGVSSAPFKLTVDALPNNLDVTQHTDNDVDDNWGDNNDWKTISRDRIFWLQYNAGGSAGTLIISDTDGLIEWSKDVTGIDDVDFLAFGSGADEDDILASWREELSDT